MTQAESPLEQAERHVREGEARVARQAALVERLTALGFDPGNARTVLAQLLTTLALAREHLRIERAAHGGPS